MQISSGPTFSHPRLSQDLTTKVLISVRIPFEIFGKHDFRKRIPVKVLSTGRVDPEKRNQQFEYIQAERERHLLLGSPVLSVDTKKKEFLGALYRDGKLYSYQGEPLKRFDHDFPHLAEGKVVPHGIYEQQANSGFVTLGSSAETAQFIGASLNSGGTTEGALSILKRTQSACFLTMGELTQVVAANLSWRCCNWLPKADASGKSPITRHIARNGIPSSIASFHT